MEQKFSPEEYRKKIYRVREVKVPSGFIFKVKRLSPIELIEEGLDDLPNPFLQYIDPETPKEARKKMEKDEEVGKKIVQFIETVITKGIVEPKVILEYKKDQIENALIWAELDEADQQCLIKAITGTGSKNE